MRLSLIPYSTMIEDLVRDWVRKIDEMGPPPPGFRYVLGEPQFTFSEDKYEVTIPIKLERI